MEKALRLYFPFLALLPLCRGFIFLSKSKEIENIHKYPVTKPHAETQKIVNHNFAKQPYILNLIGIDSLVNAQLHFLKIDVIFSLEAFMKKLSLNVQKEFCDECSLALRRFIGKMDGVNSVDTESGKIVIDFDDAKLTEEHILKISRESIEKLGYKLSD